MAFEDDLRRSLAARAQDVTPDPALFARVQSRIRRGRTFRLAFAGVAGAFALTGVALAAPTLMDRRVEFEPGPVAEQPGSEPTPTAVPTEVTSTAPVAAQAPFVYSDGAAVLMSGTGSVLGGTEGEPVTAVAARPGSTTKDLVVAVVEGETCGVIRHGTRQPARSQPAPAPGAELAGQLGCATAPVFSPEGGSLAWAALSEDAWSIQTVDWDDDGPGEDDASFGLPWDAQTPVAIQEWVWTEQSAATARGYLVLRTQRGGGWVLQQVPVERQADGALAVTGEPGPVVSDVGLTPIAFAATGVEDTDSDTSYTMEIDQGPDGIDGGRIVRTFDGRDDGTIDLPLELFDSQNTVPAGSDLWLSASGDDVLFGNATRGTAWSIDWSRAAPAAKNLADAFFEAPPVHADLLVAATTAGAETLPTEPPVATTTVDVFFGMAGADACVASDAVQREVAGPAVARGALTELLKGPTSRESNEGIETPFNANTAGALKNITVNGGEARVDFADFSGAVGTDSCTKSAILDSLDQTLLQFPTITSTRYSFDGSTQAWDSWLGSDTEHPAMPAAVAATADAILAAAQEHDYESLRRLSKGTSCSLSDQPEPCVPVWKDQEANGEDPLGILAETMQMAPARAPDTEIWAWPAEWFGGNYDGPRVGIDASGRWLYFVQEGG